jgi:FlaG/FlaF family flagellin (archaellin)
LDPRGGISELYASVLMVGVTLTVGGLVASSALGQFALANDSASISAMSQDTSARIQIGLVYIVAVSSGSCPVYGGYHEGTTVEISLFNYGGATFAPAEMVLNGTVYTGSYAILGPGSLGTYALTATACAHSSGQTLVVADSMGDEVQFES